MAERFEPGERVERCNSPKDSLVKDGTRGDIVESLQADNGELGYFVRFAAQDFRDAKPGTDGFAPPMFCAASRLRAAS